MKLKIAFMCLVMMFARATTKEVQEWRKRYEALYTLVEEVANGPKNLELLTRLQHLILQLIRDYKSLPRTKSENQDEQAKYNSAFEQLYTKDLEYITMEIFFKIADYKQTNIETLIKEQIARAASVYEDTEVYITYIITSCVNQLLSEAKFAEVNSFLNLIQHLSPDTKTILCWRFIDSACEFLRLNQAANQGIKNSCFNAVRQLILPENMNAYEYYTTNLDVAKPKSEAPYLMELKEQNPLLYCQCALDYAIYLGFVLYKQFNPMMPLKGLTLKQIYDWAAGQYVQSTDLQAFLARYKEITGYSSTSSGSGTVLQPVRSQAATATAPVPVAPAQAPGLGSLAYREVAAPRHISGATFAPPAPQFAALPAGRLAGQSGQRLVPLQQPASRRSQLGAALPAGRQRGQHLGQGPTVSVPQGWALHPIPPAQYPAAPVAAPRSLPPPVPPSGWVQYGMPAPNGAPVLYPRLGTIATPPKR